VREKPLLLVTDERVNALVDLWERRECSDMIRSFGMAQFATALELNHLGEGGTASAVVEGG